jgi:hypothetical protein
MQCSCSVIFPLTQSGKLPRCHQQRVLASTVAYFSLGQSQEQARSLNERNKNEDLPQAPAKQAESCAGATWTARLARGASFNKPCLIPIAKMKLYFTNAFCLQFLVPKHPQLVFGESFSYRNYYRGSLAKTQFAKKPIFRLSWWVGMYPANQDECSLLKKHWESVLRGSMSEAEFNFVYRSVSLMARIDFDSWRNATASVPVRYDNHLANFPLHTSPVPSFFLAPPTSSNPPQSHSPRLTKPRPPVAVCPRCKTGLDFQPPHNEREFQVRCPTCQVVSRFQLCWTCPAVILFDSVCPSCYEKDRASTSSSSAFSSLPDVGNANVAPHSPPPAVVRDQKGLANRGTEKRFFFLNFVF